MPAQGQTKRRAAKAADNPTKRTRVSRACDQCRLAREKCDGTQPACSTCSTTKRSCTYTASVKKRGIQPGYIRALELALAFLFQHEPENESLVNEELSQGGSSSLLLSRDSKESNRLHKRWRKTRFFADVDTLLSGGEPSRHEPLSPDSDSDDSDVEGASAPAQNTNQATHYPLITAQTTQQPSIGSAPALQANIRHALPPESWKLLDVYFNYTHSWFPICEKHDILRLSYSYPADGLDLSSSLPESGSHAELWSILAVASLHGSDEKKPFPQSKQFYATARSLVPGELGFFSVDHVKALLNLAIFNIIQSNTISAKILVGLASRILDVSDQNSIMSTFNYKRVHYGCFVLDNILTVQLGNEPFTVQHRIERLGPIQEDGLDEWQPWAGDNETNAAHLPKLPLLALSSFNAMTSLVGILIKVSQNPQDGFELLEIWKSLLPIKLNHIRAQESAPPLTPPATLLHITLYCAEFIMSPTSVRLLALLEVLERAIDQMGLKNIPPIVRCLLDSMNRLISTIEEFDPIARNRLNKSRAALDGAWMISATEPGMNIQRASTSHENPSTSTIQMPTPYSTTDQSLHVDASQPMLSPFHQSLSHLYATASPSRFNTSVGDVPISAPLDPGVPQVLTDLESFFDELASLDNSKTLNNQPQFMQNLGFAPDANMADLFSEYIPLQSSAFMLPQDLSTASIDQYGFYDGV